MGWWSNYDGTVTGDEMADIIDGHEEAMVKDLVARFPEMTKVQLLHALVFSFGYVEEFDGKDAEILDTDKVLQVMTRKEREEWTAPRTISCEEQEALMVAPGTGLVNAKNPFTGAAV